MSDSRATSEPFARLVCELSVAIALVALGLGVSAPGCKRKPRANGTLSGPLTGTFEGKPFVARGSIAWVGSIGGALLLKVYDRPATCGPSSDSPGPSEHFISIDAPWWHSATVGKSVVLSVGAAAPDEAYVSAAAGRPAGGESGSPMQGHLDVVAISATSGTIAVDVENDDSAFRGQIPFVICKRVGAP
jgi:hypothetical protein